MYYQERQNELHHASLRGPLLPLLLSPLLAFFVVRFLYLFLFHLIYCYLESFSRILHLALGRGNIKNTFVEVTPRPYLYFSFQSPLLAFLFNCPPPLLSVLPINRSCINHKLISVLLLGTEAPKTLFDFRAKVILRPFFFQNEQKEKRKEKNKRILILKLIICDVVFRDAEVSAITANNTLRECSTDRATP